MSRAIFVLALLLYCLSAASAQPACVSDSSCIVSHLQAIPPPTQAFGFEAFGDVHYTAIRWLGSAGFFINSRGSTVMIDPMLKGFDMPLFIELPIQAEHVPQLDAVLITHCDNDHYSVPTCQILQSVCKGFHATNYVASLINDSGMNAAGYDIGESLDIGSVRATLLFADHAWQNHFEGYSRRFNDEDFCGFWLETPDGIIWAPGDTRFYPALLTMPEKPDVIFFDFSDDPWHLGLENAIQVANAYPEADLLLSHWGTVDAPEMKPFNADPIRLKGKIIHPERVYVLAPGEEYKLINKQGGIREVKESGSVLEKQKVRLSRIVVDSTRLEEYNALLKEEIEASMRLEPGVLTLYATAEKEHPNRITILEIYAGEEAYRNHIKTSHFQKYKAGSLDLVQELELVDTNPLIEGLKIK